MESRKYLQDNAISIITTLLTTGSPTEQDAVAEAVVHAIRDLDFDTLAIAQEYEEEAVEDEPDDEEGYDWNAVDEAVHQDQLRRHEL